MTPADLQFLLSETGQRWLARVDFNLKDHLGWAAELRESLPSEQVHAILETVLLRRRAAEKFSRAGRMYFMREALEQASGEAVARWRAARLAAAGVSTVADLGCGIGGDALALAGSLRVTAVERDETRLRMAVENVRVYEPAGTFAPILADLTTLPPFPVDALFFDPARRDGSGRRLRRLADYRPPLSILAPWRAKTGGWAVKISPGIDYAELPPAEEAEVEFISVAGEVKEALLWFGGLRTGRPRRATLLPDGVSLEAAEEPPAIPVGEPAAFLYEPDGAVIRARLVQELAARLDGWLISPQIAYIAADHCVSTALARCYAIETWMPFQLKRLRRLLREREIGRVVVKKRGSPLDPDELSRKLRGPGDREAIVFLTRVGGRPAVLLGREAGR